ncbi:sensor histidine kinase [Nocardia puris]|uniref:histidine kinase n=1 Tax=Nocardia puris TaxID=208602 RepID=A0A366D7W6_9NOCA|nr:signal transduction histidine kinase [Nocardia puris]
MIRVEAKGVARGVEWLLDPRSVPVRLAVLLLAAVGCLALLSADASGTDWAIGLLATLATAGGARFPLAASLTATGLLGLAFLVGDTGPLVAKIAAALALAELAARRGGWQPLAGAGTVAVVYALHRADGLAATGYRAVVMAAAPVVIGALLRATRENAERVRRDAAELARHREREIATARVLERTAIARELHDLIAHHVSSTVLRVGVARHALTDAPAPVLEVLDDLHASGRATLTDLRKLVAVLRDPEGGGESFVAPADLPDAVAAAVDSARGLGLRVDAAIDENLPTVDALAGLTLLRLTQEGLANVLKHAGPDATAELSLRVGATEAHFDLRDNGFPRGEPSGHGVGLIGLRERVELLGGTVTAGPGGDGWRLTAQVPLAGAAI